MKKMLTVILLSFLTALTLISGGYGFWEKTLTIEGNIVVIEESNQILQGYQTEGLNALEVRQSGDPDRAANIPGNSDGTLTTNLEEQSTVDSAYN